MSIETISLIIAAFVSGSLGVASLMHNFRSRICLSFALLTSLLFVHDALKVFELFGASPSLSTWRLHALSLLFIGPSTLWFLFEVLPSFSASVKRFCWVYLPLVAVGFILVSLQRFRSHHEWVFFFTYALILGPAAMAIVGFGRAEKLTPLKRERLRLRYTLWLGVFALILYISNTLYFFGVSVPPLGTLARVLFLLFVFQSFVLRELVTAQEVVAKFSLFGGIALILSTIYFMLVSWVGSESGLFFFNTLIASFVIVVLFDPIRQLTRKLTRRLFLHRHFILEEELNNLSAELRGLWDLTKLSRRIGRSLKKCLHVDSYALFVRDREGLCLFEVDPTQVENPKELYFSDSLVEYMNLRRGRPFVLETIENDQGSFKLPQPRKFFLSCKRSMEAIGADLIIPIVHEGRVMGFCAACSDETILLSNEQLRLFVPLSRQIGLIVSNAETYSQVSDRDKLAAVGEMAAGLAHEIRNPLGAIKGAAELLKEPVGQETKSEFLDIIVDESNRLNIVLNEFLDYARPRRDSKSDRCDAMQVIKHTLALVLQDSEMEFEVECAHKSLFVNADPDALKQVLLNLCFNAVESVKMTESKPRLKIKVRQLGARSGLFSLHSLALLRATELWREVKPRSPFLEITVEDNGIGISAEEMSKIFVPFYTTKPKGTGLGLAICQRLVQSMGGSIHVKRNRPSGTVFILHLPVRRGEARAHAEQAMGAGLSQLEPSLKGQLK